LIGRPDVLVRAMVRDRTKFHLVAPNIEVVTGDMDEPSSLVGPTRGVSHVFLTLPMDTHIADRQMAVIDALKASGNSHVLNISGAVNDQGDELDQLHITAINHLKTSGLPRTLISTSSVT
jgi:uncharacterized protein YbjT (DUF2867 family)